MDSSRALKGRQSRNAGLAFEQIVIGACAFYEQKHIAVIDKTPEPMKILQPYDRRNGRFVACFAKQAQPDFKGILLDGTMVLFDAKHTDSARLTRRVVTDEQSACFTRYEAMGARCFLVVSMGFRSYFRIPWRSFDGMKEAFGHCYMTEEDMEPFAVQYTQGVLHFLDGLELKENT